MSWQTQCLNSCLVVVSEMPWQGRFPQLFRSDGCSAAAEHAVGDVLDDPFPLQNSHLANPGTAKMGFVWGRERTMNRFQGNKRGHGREKES